MKDILYNTYNGEIKSLRNIIVDENVDEFVRAAALDVMCLGKYDSKYSVHYFCDEWISKLLELLIENGDANLYREVKNVEKRCYKISAG